MFYGVLISYHGYRQYGWRKLHTARGNQRPAAGCCQRLEGKPGRQSLNVCQFYFFFLWKRNDNKQAHHREINQRRDNNGKTGNWQMSKRKFQLLVLVWGKTQSRIDPESSSLKLDALPTVVSWPFIKKCEQNPDYIGFSCLTESGIMSLHPQA